VGLGVGRERYGERGGAAPSKLSGEGGPLATTTEPACEGRWMRTRRRG